MTDVTYFDAETESLPLEELVLPEFTAPGNYKDPDKIAANIAEQKEKWLERTALSPLSGRILCIGIIVKGSFTCLDGGGDEKKLLEEFNAEVKTPADRSFIGWNIFGFDLPFIQKRCFFHGIKSCIRFGFDSYRQDRFIDLEHLWNNRNKSEHTALNTVAKFLRVGEKTGEGKDFGRLWHENKSAALEYLKTDCKLLQGIAERVGVVQKDQFEPMAF